MRNRIVIACEERTLKRIIQKIGRYTDILKYSWRLSRSRPQPLFPTIRQAFTLCRKQRFTADEAFALGLLQLDDGSNPPRDLVSRRRQAQIQRRLNPKSWASVLSDKGIFHRFCETVGLPTPQVYALYFRTTPGYCPDGTSLWGRDQWTNFITKGLPSEFIVKPCIGYGGRGVVAFTKVSPGTFSSSLGRDMTAAQIVEFMYGHRDTESFLIQERLRSHSQLVELAGCTNLQTLRLTTYIDRKMQCRRLFCFLKLMTLEGVVIDNVGDGRAGNLVCHVCTEMGTILAVYVRTLDGTGSRAISHHPVTGRELIGLRIPQWGKACDLVHQAAHAFLPVRSIGWDVALGDDGVRLLEGNIWWDRIDFSNTHIIDILDELDGTLGPAGGSSGAER